MLGLRNVLCGRATMVFVQTWMKLYTVFIYNFIYNNDILKLNSICHLSSGWGDRQIWTQTYEEALFKSKTR